MKGKEGGGGESQTVFCEGWGVALKERRGEGQGNHLPYPTFTEHSL